MFYGVFENFWIESIYICDGNLKEAASQAQDLSIREQNLGSSTEVVDIPTSFDRTWSSCVWTARRGAVSAIAQILSLVIEQVSVYHWISWAIHWTQT